MYADQNSQGRTSWGKDIIIIFLHKAYADLTHNKRRRARSQIFVFKPNPYRTLSLPPLSIRAKNHCLSKDTGFFIKAEKREKGGGGDG